MDVQLTISALSDEIKSQRNTIDNLQKKLEESSMRCEQYAQAYELINHQLKELLRHRFGKKSERFIDPESQQMDFFSDVDTFIKADKAGDALTTKETEVDKKSPKSKKKSNKELPRRIEIISATEEQKKCSCGQCKTVIRYETRELIHYQPAQFEIVEERREVVACPKGCDKQVVTAPVPLHVLPKIKATVAFLAFIIVSKLDDRQPIYHLEKMLYERYGIDCSRQTMARWVIDLVEMIQPLYNLMKDYIIENDIASCDATTLQVLNEPGRAAETKSYIYCMRGGPPEKYAILYEYNDRLHKEFVVNWFAGFEGYLHVDGDNFFELIGEYVKLSHCNAHARRKFEPIAKATKGRGVAKEAMRFYKELYKIERHAKNNNFTADERYQLRQEKAKPLMENFKSWLENVYPTVLPQSTLGKAMNYCIKLWPGLTRFLEDGRLEIDNNLTEQEIKPFVIARKNFLFSSSVDGAHALCMHMSMIRTAKAHGLDPYHYYVKVLTGLPHCKTVEDYEKLLPWNIE